MLRIATANLAFQLGGDRKLIGWLCAQADVLLLVEAKTHDIATLVPAGWTVLQHTGGTLADGSPVDKARAGSAIAYRTEAVSASDFGLTHGSGPAPGVMRRWIAHATVTEAATGRSIVMAATHWPLKRTGVQGRHTANVRAWAAKHPALFIGGDGNQPPAALADRLGLDGWGREVMTLLWDGCDVTGFRAERVPGSDHPVIFATVTLREDNPVTATKGKAADVIRVAAAEIGYREGGGKSNNNDQKFSDEVPGLEWSDRQPWCQTFVTWCAMKAGVQHLYGDPAKPTASCDIAGAWFKRQGRWSEYPAIGAQVFYGTPSDLNHTGIVESYDADYITTIEGNTNASGSREGDGVYRKRRRRRDAYVVGYGYPDFPEGIVSADPAWKKVPTPPAPPVVGKASRGIKVDQALSLLRDAADHAAGKGWKWRASTIRAAAGILERLPLR